MGEVPSFIDADEEEDHDEVIEEVVRRLVGNDLYKNRGRKGEGSIRMADSERSSRYIEVFRTC